MRTKPESLHLPGDRGCTRGDSFLVVFAKLGAAGARVGEPLSFLLEAYQIYVKQAF